MKRRWEGGRLCRERPWRLRQQRYGSQVGERRIFRGGTLWSLLKGPSTNRERNSISLGS